MLNTDIYYLVCEIYRSNKPRLYKMSVFVYKIISVSLIQMTRQCLGNFSKASMEKKIISDLEVSKMELYMSYLRVSGSLGVFMKFPW